VALPVVFLRSQDETYQKNHETALLSELFFAVLVQACIAPFHIIASLSNDILTAIREAVKEIASRAFFRRKISCVVIEGLSFFGIHPLG